MKPRSAIWVVFLLSAIVLVPASDADAASLTWNGVLKVVVEDTGTGTYTGGTPDVSQFSGSVTYDDTCSGLPGCIVEPFPPEETNYVFPGGFGSLTGLGVTTNGIESSVAISNEELIDQDEANLLAVFGINVAVGTSSDVWSVASETAGAVIEWEVAYLYLNTDPFSNTNYTATPPPNPDLILFQVDEGDEVTYFAFGEVTTAPEPGGAAVLAALTCALLGLRRGRCAA